MKHDLLPWLLVFLAACNNGAGQMTDPPPTPRLTIEEARRQADERSRQERDLEGGMLTAEELDALPQTGPPARIKDDQPRTTSRPLNDTEQKLLHDALVTCSQAAASVRVMVEPGGVVFLAPGQRFLEADLACYAQKLGSVRLHADVGRTGTINLP